MQAFEWHRPNSLADARALLGGEAALIAGGHTLLPAMKSGLRQPSALIDLSHIPGLAGIVMEDDRLVVGAMARHRAIETSALVQRQLPVLAAMAALVGDPAVRARGTLGGALANNDPAADYPAAVLALAAEVRTDRRTIAADDFFEGMFATALASDEIITAVAFPCVASAYAKYRHPISRYALAGVCVARHADHVRVVVTGAGSGVFRWAEAEEALMRGADGAALAGLRPDPADLSSDLHASPQYRAQLCGVMLIDAVATLHGLSTS
jgi:carbon-monoxide dehydrogenase medium subunit